MQRRRITAAALATGLLLCAGPTAAFADDQDAGSTGQPVESVRSSGFRDDVPPDGTVNLLAVRRVSNVTVVYFSLGMTAGNPRPDWSVAQYAADAAVTTGTVFRPTASDAMVVDRQHHVAYTPLVKSGDGCVVCSDAAGTDWYFGDLKPGESFVGFVGLPALPTGVDRVSVVVANRIFEDVPVVDGALQPQVPLPMDGYTTVGLKLGQGWPTVDTAAAATADSPKQFSIHPMQSTVQEGQVSKRSGEQETNFDLAASVLFDKDQAVVKPAGRQAIAQLASRLRGQQGTVAVTGYTDNLGSHQHGVELSRRRAGAVAAILKPLLGGGVTLTTAGLAEANPVASNETEAGRELNRRVTITVKGQR